MLVPSLKSKNHTLTRLWLKHSFTINLTNQLAFSVIILIPCFFSSNDYMLVQGIWSTHSNPLKSYNCFIQPITNTKFQIRHQTTKYNQCTVQSCFNTSYQTKWKHKNTRVESVSHLELNQVWLALLSSQGWCFPLLTSVWFSVYNLITTCK